ncbi:MAG: hypothetical protein SVX38_05695 [Chloroflexota bacterium]|nr:hypothetical protein [Chloroflexota bacterium]
MEDETKIIETNEGATEAGEAEPTSAATGRLPKNMVSIIAAVVAVIILCLCLAVVGGGYYVYNQGLLAGIGIGTKPSVKVVQDYMTESVKAIQNVRQAYEPLLKYVDPEEREQEMLNLPTSVEMDELEYRIIEEFDTRTIIGVKGEYSITHGSGDDAVTRHRQLDETITVVKAEDGKWYLSELPGWWPPY